MKRFGQLVFCLMLLIGVVQAAKTAAARNPAKKFSNADCLACHNDSTLTKDVDGKPVSLYVNEEKYKASMHGGMFNCTDCHEGIKDLPHEPGLGSPNCGNCHADAQAAYDRGFHSQAIHKGDAKAARCIDCHGGPHELLAVSDPQSKVSHANIPATCGACHGQKFVMEPSGHSAQPFFSYKESVHGRAVANGSEKAAVCTDCHGSHEILAAGDPKSPIFKFNVPATCAKCHEPVKQEFARSIHGQAIARGNWQAPVCTDCHGIHLIKPHIDPTSSVAAQALARTTCARCHEGVRLAQELGVPGNRATSYMESYHGLASKLGSTVVANCASCHGVHNILPPSDPNSTVSRQNLVKTCGQCHPGVTDKFALSKVHIDMPLSADIGSVAVRWVRRFYVWMIVLVIGGMALHNFIIWRKKAIARRNSEHRVVTRMTSSQRWQHLTLLASFFVLVITGFALKYPDSWFAALLHMNEKVRGIAHRAAAVVLMGAGAYHVGYAIFTREGRRLLKDFLPVPKDVRDVWAVLRHYFGMNTEKPAFARFNYAEKAEYWALVWGMIVMASTGLMLWAKVSVGHLLPRWSLDVATAVHFYEAVLATLAIVVWHFYQIFLDPDTYPMNWAWWDGKMSVEHYAEEHPLDTATLLAAAEAEVAEPAEQAEDKEEVGSENGNGKNAEVVLKEEAQEEEVSTRR